MYKLFVIGLAVAAASALPAQEKRADLDCSRSDSFISCWGIKTSGILLRAARAADIHVIDGLVLTRDVPAERAGKALESEAELMNSLPEESVSRALKVAGMVYDAAIKFFESHSIQFDFPAGSEGRAKTGLKGGLTMKNILAAAGLKFGLATLAFGGLAILALKALFVGKIALLIASILAFQKFLGSGSGFPGNFFSKSSGFGSDSSAQSWSQPTQTQGYYKRSLEEEDAHNLAYSAHSPAAELAE